MPSIRRSFALSFAQRYSALAIQLGAVVVLARLLTPAEFGTFAVASAVVTLATVLQDFGVGNYLVQERTLDRGKLETAYCIAFVIAWPLGIGLYAASDAIAAWYGEPTLAPVIAILSLSFFAMPFGTPPIAMMRRDLQFGRLYALGVAGAAATAAISLALALNGGGAISLACGFVAGSLVSAAGAHLLRPGMLLLRPGLRHWRAVLSFGGQSSAIAALTELGNQVPSIAAGRMLGIEAAGLLHRATSTIQIYRKSVLDGIMPVLLPAFAAKLRLGHALKESYLRGVAYLTAVGWPFSVVLALLAHPVLRVLFGPQWDAAVPLVQILCIAGALTPFVHLGRPLFIALGRIDLSLRIQLVVQPLKLGLVILAAFHGLVWVAAALCLPPLLNAWLAHRHLARLLGYSAGDLLAAVARSAGVTLASAAAPLLVVLTLGAQPEHSLLALALGGGGAALGWLAGVIACGHPARSELTMAAARLFPRFA
ncbi:MAG: lipopolysaccharide biosynthesis protein [Bacteroidota bacterium]